MWLVFNPDVLTLRFHVMLITIDVPVGLLFLTVTGYDGPDFSCQMMAPVDESLSRMLVTGFFCSGFLCC